MRTDHRGTLRLQRRLVTDTAPRPEPAAAGGQAGDQPVPADSPCDRAAHWARSPARSTGAKLYLSDSPRWRSAAHKKPRQPPVLHGGAPGTGAPFGERNGNYRHCRRTAEAIAERGKSMNFISEARKFAQQALD